ncbi:KCC4 (YCL024W) and GIN4 (YDR507C) [Zygosaccharomyces parabailii]|uniref:non-specific serine/threonine protein kinase n=1 Tax=Zygosaccharomyces bailii (strain CLIB 213 / ATCC 58445 / CBS 680 / BCRC 21525 / NBRC 1098 / NCYC 1416 / NRRL Y-2227) TaxID=1333698 RepID=A0A8J2X5C2_ZYGB2|nr:KCC4 (YCL024W) and GIN4 (YDR507C) [Zygosaccharomyces parabailii]CDF91810.1 ZYBA0S14-01640g1_1 [Zygosaccharomyces bailii CLIB 213]
MSSTNKKSVPTVRGDKVGPWKLGETLGFGSTGKVQLAYNEITHQQAAMKEISKAIFNSKTAPGSSSIAASTPDALPYGIEREIIIMKLLNHPNVLRLYDVWETNPSLYMVLEYAEKGELFNLLVERGPLPESEAVCFFRQIIIGVSYCHALGIVHRDLKPENLLLDHKLNIKIADFGMAALETEDKLLETSCGSPHYAAPEIVSGIPYHGFASDVWSCGVIFFALLTGRLPFDEEDGNIRNLLLKVQSGKFEMPDDDEISPEAQDLLAKILTVDPELRIKTRDILKHPLLQKYPNISDNKSIRNLPREDTYLHPLSDSGSSEIDKSILQNLVVLWHGRPSSEIAAKLKEPGANAEKTLYALLARFKNDTEREALRQNKMKKRTSSPVGAGITGPSTTVANPSGGVPSASTNKSNAHVSPKKRNRTSMINASSSHKRPVSFIKLSGSNHSGSNTSSSSTTPSKRVSVNLSSNKRVSATKPQSNGGGSPTPTSRSKRVSIMDPDKSNDAPPVPIDMLKDYHKGPANKRISRTNVRLSFKPTNKRGSVTTKLISTYAKLSEDDDWEYIEKETKRTSSDFATLCDEIFEHEKFEQIRKEKAELERKVRETKEREERERREKEELELRERLAKQEGERSKPDSENDAHARESKNEREQEVQDVDAPQSGTANARSISAPLERNKRDSMVNLQSDIDQIFGQRTMSLQTRPVSRLDPGLFYADDANDELETPDEEEDERLRTEKTILETIRRSKFLGSSFDLQKELDNAKRNDELKRKFSIPQTERAVSTTNDHYVTEILPKSAVATAPLRDAEVEPRKISDISVPQFTRKSRLFSESNKRLSVLSMYSTKQSYSNLSNLLNSGETQGNTSEGSSSPSKHADSKKGSLEKTISAKVTNTAGENNDVAQIITPSETRLYEVSGTSVGSDLSNDMSSKHSMKLNFADRFQGSEHMDSRETSHSKNVNLPVLPPLDGKKEANGLGIYKTSSESLKDVLKPTPVSKLEDTASQPEEYEDEVEHKDERKSEDEQGHEHESSDEHEHEELESETKDEETENEEQSLKHSGMASLAKERSARSARTARTAKSGKSEVARKSSATHESTSGGPAKNTSLNNAIPKRGVEEFSSKKDSSRAPLKDITTAADKKRNVSFFRKFSKTNERDPQGFEAQLNTSIAAKQLFLGLQNLLRGWTQYGLKDVKSRPDAMILTGKLASENLLSRSTLFEMVVWSKGKNSAVGFRKKSGSSKAIKRLAKEVEKVLMKEGVITR